MDDQRRKLLRVAMFGGSFLLVVIGVGIGLAGEWFGWLIAGFGALDALTMPLVLRAIESRGAADPTADPSHNPYARED